MLPHPLGWGHACCRPPTPHLASVCLQDEVAHTVTESRVLQNTRHPFLTVSGTPSDLCTWEPQASPFGQTGSKPNPAAGKHRHSVGQVAGPGVAGLPRWPDPKPRGGSFFLDSGVVSAPQTTGAVTLQDGPGSMAAAFMSSRHLAQLVKVGTLFFCFYFTM